MIPHLIFEDDFLLRMLVKLDQRYDHELIAHKIASVINKVVILHSGPFLKFSLIIPGDKCDSQIIHDYIDQWIVLFSRNGIKQLILEDSEILQNSAHHFFSLDLTHLRLTRVWLPYRPAFGRITYPTNLELIHATYNFGEGIFDCPALEKLTLIICVGLLPTNFHAPNLKCLHQVYREITLEYSLVGYENLKEYSFMLSPGSLSLMQTETSNMVKVLGSLHKIEKFSIGMDFIKYLGAGGSPNRLSKPLPYLKTLNVYDINFADLSEVSCLLCLIRSAPNLCKLHIRHDAYPDGGDFKNYSIEDSEDWTVDFSNFKGLKTELELVKFLLGQCPLLKTMLIHRSEEIKKDVAFTLAEEMLQYSRASRVQIRHLKHPVGFEDFDFEIWIDQFES